jgi:hypothetical protein
VGLGSAHGSRDARIHAVSRFPFRRMSSQQGIEHVWAAAEAGIPQTFDGIGQLDQPAACGEVKDAQRSRDSKPHAPCNRHCVPVIHEQELGRDPDSDPDRSSFAVIKAHKTRVIVLLSG